MAAKVQPSARRHGESVSVAMATYNGERYLQEQLDSLSSQSVKPDELVVCDDCSRDQTVQILKEFSKNAVFPVRVYQNERNLGYSKNFERAINLCRGDIIFLSDQDDVWFPEKLNVILSNFHAPQTPLVVFNDAEITNESLETTGLSVAGQLKSANFSSQTFVMGACTAFRSELRSLLLPIPSEHSAYDSWIHKVGLVLDRRVFAEQVLQYYRRHDGNASEWFTNRLERVTLWDRLVAYAPGNSRSACIRRLACLGDVLTRLVESEDEVVQLLGGSCQVAKATDDVRREQVAVQRRLTLLRKGQFSRLPAGWRMLRDGDYAYFSGRMSFIKDILF